MLPSAGATDAPPTARERLRAEAKELSPLVQSSIAQEFLAAVDTLPAIETRTLYRDPETRKFLSIAEFEQLSAEKQAVIEARPADEQMYYYTRYGTPLAFVRVLELAGQHGVRELAEKKILDFGYGTIGHLRVMASRGAHAVGLDVDPLLTALYNEPSDTGEIANPSGPAGRITLVSGRLAEGDIKAAVGDGYDLITSKNTLKRGYIHPPPEVNVDPRMLVDLGVTDEQFVQTMYHILKPGGLFIIYNLSPKPAPPGEKYIPWADGRCPFERTIFEQVGFEVLAFDHNDNEAARTMARALGWDQGARPMDLEHDLFGECTIVRKPAANR